MDASTVSAPPTNGAVTSKPSQPHDTSVEMSMEPPVAKPLSRLSAYAMTAAVQRPPPACSATTAKTSGEKPASGPRSRMHSPSLT